MKEHRTVISKTFILKIFGLLGEHQIQNTEKKNFEKFSIFFNFCQFSSKISNGFRPKKL